MGAKNRVDKSIFHSHVSHLFLNVNPSRNLVENFVLPVLCQGSGNLLGLSGFV